MKVRKVVRVSGDFIVVIVLRLALLERFEFCFSKSAVSSELYTYLNQIPWLVSSIQALNAAGRSWVSPFRAVGRIQKGFLVPA